jgi:putative ABC transport system substrate-binding protein
MPVIGLLSASREPFAQLVAAFRQGLGELGYVEGKNVAIEAEGDYDRLPKAGYRLVDRRVSVLAATGRESVGLPAKAATATIPIVFSGGGDPIERLEMNLMGAAP